MSGVMLRLSSTMEIDKLTVSLAGKEFGRQPPPTSPEKRQYQLSAQVTWTDMRLSEPLEPPMTARFDSQKAILKLFGPPWF